MSILAEVRAARDEFARSFNYDIAAMTAELRRMDAAGDWPVVRRQPRPSADGSPSEQPAE